MFRRAVELEGGAYVRLGDAFLYLAVALDVHLEAGVVVRAPDMAIQARNPAPGSLIHHSDRDVQYACHACAARLEARGMSTSMSRVMSRVADPYAKAESFMMTRKAVAVKAKSYPAREDAPDRIGAFIDNVYIVDPLHSAFAYKPQAEFEAELNRSRKPQTKVEAELSPDSPCLGRGVRSSPRWRAWTAHPGKPIPLNTEGGWHFPTEWPPGREAARGAA